MKSFFSKALDDLSDFFAARKGLLPLLGVLLIILNFCCKLFLHGWITDNELLLHLGIIIAILGLLLSKAL